MNTHTANTYNLEELKAQFPKGYAKALQKWEENCAENPCAWSDEIMDSLKATVKACGATLEDYSIGSYGYSFVNVSVEDEEESEEIQHNGEYKTVYTPKDAKWFETAVLVKNSTTENSYFKEDGTVHFPGNCSLTGYCADDDFLKSVYNSLLNDGDTLTEALQGLSSVAVKMLEAEEEYERSEENFLEINCDNEYTADGEEWY